MPGKIVFIPKGGGDIAIGGVITGATEGSVLFAGAAGVLAQDNVHFFWDDTTNSLNLITDSTTQDGFSITGDTLTTGSLASFNSNGADTGTRDLVEIINDNALATGTTALRIQQDAAAVGLRIDQNGDFVALGIFSLATTAPAFAIVSPANTTSDVISVDGADSLTDGSILKLNSSSADTSNRDLFVIRNQNVLATGAVCMRLDQSAAATGLFLNQDGNASALLIDSESTSASVINILTPATTSGVIFSCSSANSLTTGAIMNLISNSSDANVRDLVIMTNDSISAVQARVLKIKQDSRADAVLIDKNTFGNALVIDQDVLSTSDAVALLVNVSNTGTGGAHAAIFQTGNVGIQTTDPGAPLQVRDDPDAAGTLASAGVAAALMRTLNNNGGNTPSAAEPALVLTRGGITAQAFANIARFDISRFDNTGSDSRTQLDFRLSEGNLTTEGTNTPTIMSLRSNGNVGIGTTAPTRPLHIVGDDNAIRLERTSATTGFVILQTDTSGRGELIASNDLVVGNTGNAMIVNAAGDITIGDAFGDASDVTLTIDNSSPIFRFAGAGMEFERQATAVSANAGDDYFVGVTDTSVARTITLTTASVADGRTYIIKDESGAAGTNNITIATQAAQTIDGASTVVITVDHGVLRVYSDGTNWFTF